MDRGGAGGNVASRFDYLTNEVAKWARMIKASGVRAD